MKRTTDVYFRRKKVGWENLAWKTSLVEWNQTSLASRNASQADLKDDQEIPRRRQSVSLGDFK